MICYLYFNARVDLMFNASGISGAGRGRHSFDNGFAFLNVGFCYNFASSCRNISQGFSF